MSFKRKVINPANMPIRGSLLTPLFMYVSLDYLNAPIWVFAAWMSLWVVVFILSVAIDLKSEKLPEITEDTFNKVRGERGYTGAAGMRGERGEDQLIELSRKLESVKKI